MSVSLPLPFSTKITGWVEEVKAVELLAPVHSAQVISYLKATRQQPWLLINFNTPVLKTVSHYTALVRQFTAAPPGKLYCLHGGRDVFRLSLYAASRALLRGVPIALVDGTNRFDLYAVADVARRLGNRRATPEDLLRRIFVSRAFTCYQMEAVVTERLPRFLAREKIPVAVIFGLLDTFYDEQAPLFEVRAGLRRVMASLRQLKRDNIAVLLALQNTVPASPERRTLFPSVAAHMDHVFSLADHGRGLPQRHRNTEKNYDGFVV